MKKKIVVSLGGNALSQSGNVSYKELLSSLQNISRTLVRFVKKEYNIAIVFGSGPQVGALILQNELAKKQIQPMPLDVLDAEVQGELGYLLEQALQNALREERKKKAVVSVLTQVVVDKKDPAFKNPSKPVGQFLTREQAQQLEKRGIAVREDAGRGWRKVVPSPLPKKIDEAVLIKKIVKEAIVIACGGGGIPVIEERGKMKGVEAVIDKDHAAALLANTINADELIIITSVPCVYRNYGKKNQQPIQQMSVNEAKKYLKEGHFLAGSMRPKIEAAIRFLEQGGKRVIIAEPRNILRAVNGKSGTRITQN
ncbi:MAG: carbamate kinase [Nanoarchaeota archaeon]